MLLALGMQLRLLDGSVDQLLVFLGIEVFGDDPAGREDGEFGDLATKVFDRTLALLLNFAARLGDHGIGLLAGFRFQLLPKLFSTSGHLLDQGLALASRLVELLFVLFTSCFSLAFRLL